MKKMRPRCGACNGNGQDAGAVHGVCFHCEGTGYDIMTEKTAELKKMLKPFRQVGMRQRVLGERLARFLKENPGYVSTDDCNQILEAVAFKGRALVGRCRQLKRRLAKT